METSLFINGQWEMGEGEVLTSISPFDTSILWKKATASLSQLQKAIQSAQQAQRAWQDLGYEKRLSYLKNFQKALEEEKEMLANCLSQETGKLYTEAKQEIQASIAKLNITLEAYEKRTPETSWKSGDKTFSLYHKPHGVVAIYGPYNFPLHLPNGHILPALLAGNCVLFKPSEHTPFTAEKMTLLWEKSGLMPGVFSLLQGKLELAKALAESPHIQGLFFTGSYHTGKYLSTLFGKTPERILALELGGNNPLIYSHSHEVKAAVYTTLLSSFITSGQRCTCARRLLVIQGQETHYVQELLKASKSLKIGKNHADKNAFMGPLISQEAAQSILKSQERLIQQGAKPLLAMKSLGGAFLTPGILDATGVALPDEEYFGPLLILKYVKDLNEAIQEASNTAYGLSAGILTEKREEFLQLKKRLNAGIINVNCPTTGASSALPFGGVGKSGNHRPSAYYAADYCAYPCVSTEQDSCQLPPSPPPGMKL